MISFTQKEDTALTIADAQDRLADPPAKKEQTVQMKTRAKRKEAREDTESSSAPSLPFPPPSSFAPLVLSWAVAALSPGVGEHASANLTSCLSMLLLERYN